MNIEDEELTFDEYLAVLKGDDLDGYRIEKKFRMRIFKESQKYEGTPSSEWPPITFNWDISKEGQRFSLDSITKEGFREHYPGGFLLGYVYLIDFDKNLCAYSRRDEGELWDVGSSGKLAQLIVYLSERHKISPPFVKPLESKEVIFNGGHHRYAIAKELAIKKIPIHVMPEHKLEIDKILNVEWINS